MPRSPDASHAARYGAIALGVGTVLLVSAGFALGGGTVGGLDGSERALSVADAFQLVTLLATATVGLVIALRRPGNPIGWIFSSLGLITALFVAAAGYAIHTLVIAPGSLPGGDWAAWFRHWADRSAAALLLLAFLLFPTGRLESSRWRTALLLPPLVALGFLARAFVPGPLAFLGVPNPLGIEWVPRSIDDGVTGGIPLAAGSIVAAAQLVTRFRAANPAEREQIKWLALPLIALLVAITVTVATLALGLPSEIVNSPAVSAPYAIAEFALPVCMAIAILRYRLYDIDVLINRALVYGTTTAGIAVAFFVGIILLQALLRPITGGSEIAVALSTLASVALFHPVRRRLQEGVDRRFYRSRYDSARTLDAFSVRLRDQVALDAVRADLIDAAGATVQPAHASLWLRTP
jgi:hypothetical protein